MRRPVTLGRVVWYRSAPHGNRHLVKVAPGPSLHVLTRLSPGVSTFGRTKRTDRLQTRSRTSSGHRTFALLCSCIRGRLRASYVQPVQKPLGASFPCVLTGFQRTSIAARRDADQIDDTGTSELVQCPREGMRGPGCCPSAPPTLPTTRLPNVRLTLEPSSGCSQRVRPSMAIAWYRATPSLTC